MTRRGRGLALLVGAALAAAPAGEAATVRDEFAAVSYAGSDGTRPWSGDWIERGESDGPATGLFRVEPVGFPGWGNALAIGGPRAAGTRRIHRGFDAGGASAPPVVSFRWRRELVGRPRGKIDLLVSGDDGATWTRLARWDLDGTDVADVAFEASSPVLASPLARIAFFLHGQPESVFRVDDFQVAWPTVPDLVVTKSVVVASDPVNGGANPKAIPGGVVLYTIATRNEGDAPTDPGTIVVSDALPAGVALSVADIAGPGSGPLAFVDGAVASGLSYSFGGLGDPGDGLEFSADGGASWGYAPVPDADGFDPAVTHFRATLAGALGAANVAGAPSFELRFRARVD